MTQTCNCPNPSNRVQVIVSLSLEMGKKTLVCVDLGEAIGSDCDVMRPCRSGILPEVENILFLLLPNFFATTCVYTLYHLFLYSFHSIHSTKPFLWFRLISIE